MRKTQDFRTINEKIYDFVFRYRKRILFCSFVLALSIFLISVFTLNKGGLYIVFLYPLALICFFLELYIKGWTRDLIKFFFPAITMLISIIMFILGFFLEV